MRTALFRELVARLVSPPWLHPPSLSRMLLTDKHQHLSASTGATLVPAWVSRPSRGRSCRSPEFDLQESAGSGSLVKPLTLFSRLSILRDNFRCKWRPTCVIHGGLRDLKAISCCWSVWIPRHLIIGQTGELVSWLVVWCWRFLIHGVQVNSYTAPGT